MHAVSILRCIVRGLPIAALIGGSAVVTCVSAVAQSQPAGTAQPGTAATPPARPADPDAPQQAPNSRVLLKLPPGFVPSARFSGFEHAASGSSVIILEMPAQAYASLEGSFTKERFATRGIQDAEAGKLERQGEHIYMRARQASAMGPVAKFILAFRADDLTVLVTVNVPDTALKAQTFDRAGIERMLASARVTAASKPAKPQFTLAYLGPFKKAGMIAGSGVLYNLTGAIPKAPVKDAPTALIVAPSLDGRRIDNAEAFSRRVVRTLGGINDIEIASAAATTVDGLAGTEVTATGLDTATGQRVSIYQVVLVRPAGGYFRIVGLAGATEAGARQDEFRKVVQSFKVAR